MDINEAIQLAHEYYQAGNLRASAKIYVEILQVQPENIAALSALGEICYKLGNYTLAISCIERDLELNPTNALGYYNLGIALKELKRFDEAIVSFKTSLRINPNIAEAYNNLGFIFGQIQGLFMEAMDCYDKAIELNPNYAQAHFNKSSLLLLSGNFNEGWKEYEWRRKISNYVPLQRNFPQPLWNRSDIQGKTIFLYSEQGFGDTIQFARYIPIVAQQEATILVECQKELVALLQKVNGVKKMVTRNEKPPAFDVHYPLLSLPSLFDTTLEDIPARVPYINAESSLASNWRNKMQADAAKLKVGLVWAGKPGHANDCNRSCSINIFLSLARLDGVTFYSLQKGAAAQQAKFPPQGIRLIDYTDDIYDFSDTAALIENLDLVISVDTSVAHLAGAMGKPVWILLPFIPDWRWMLNRDDSPWYPTMQLFRQPAIGDWTSVITSVADKLQKQLDSL
jgi:tetratricopeptide (TPR) repeat protein